MELHVLYLRISVKLNRDSWLSHQKAFDSYLSLGLLVDQLAVRLEESLVSLADVDENVISILVVLNWGGALLSSDGSLLEDLKASLLFDLELWLLVDIGEDLLGCLGLEISKVDNLIENLIDEDEVVPDGIL